MAIRTVIRLGHPHLRRVAPDYPVDAIGSAEFQELIKDMRETMHETGGIGLAAPQIDVDYRIAIIEIEEPSTRYGEMEPVPFRTYINPTITVLEGADTAGYWEGCLSVPGLRGFVERPQHVRVDYTDEQGQAQSLVAEGFLATVFQHEFDHLDGILYVDRITDKARFSYQEEFVEFHRDLEKVDA